MAKKTTKQVKANVKMVIMGGGATPAPPVGSILGAHGVPLMEFIQAFNDKTSDQRGQKLTVHVTIYDDKSFEFRTVGEQTSELIKKKVGISKGSKVPNKEKVAKLSSKDLEEIAEIKLVDLNANDLESAKKIIAGSARAMGVEVEQ